MSAIATAILAWMIVATAEGSPPPLSRFNDLTLSQGFETPYYDVKADGLTAVRTDRSNEFWRVATIGDWIATGQHDVSILIGDQTCAPTGCDVAFGVVFEGAPVNDINGNTGHYSVSGYNTGDYGAEYLGNKWGTSYGERLFAGQVVTISVDMVARTMQFAVDGIDQGPFALKGGSGKAFSELPAKVKFAVATVHAGQSYTIVQAPPRHEPDFSRNVLYGQPATVTSECYTPILNKAWLTDGKGYGAQWNNQQYWASCGYTHSDSAEIEADEPGIVAAVRVWKRCDCCTNRNAGLRVYVKQLKTETWVPCGSVTTLAEATCDAAPGEPGSFWERRCAAGVVTAVKVVREVDTTLPSRAGDRDELGLNIPEIQAFPAVQTTQTDTTTTTTITTITTATTTTTTTQLVDYAKLDRTIEQLLADLMARFDGNEAELEAVAHAIAEAQVAILTEVNSTSLHLSEIHKALANQVGTGLDELASLIDAIPGEIDRKIADAETRMIAATTDALTELTDLEYHHAKMFEIQLAKLMEALGESHTKETELIIKVEDQVIAVMDKTLAGLTELQNKLAADSRRAAVDFANTDEQLARSLETLKELHLSIEASSSAVLTRFDEAFGELDKVAMAVTTATADGFDKVVAQMGQFTEQIENTAVELESGHERIIDTVDAGVRAAESSLADQIAAGFDHAEARLQVLHSSSNADHDGLEAELDGLALGNKMLANGLDEARVELESNQQMTEQVLATLTELKSLIGIQSASKTKVENFSADASTSNSHQIPGKRESHTITPATGAVIGVLAVGLIAALIALIVLKTRVRAEAEDQERGIPIAEVAAPVTSVMVHSGNEYSMASGNGVMPEGTYDFPEINHELTGSNYDCTGSEDGPMYAFGSSSAQIDQAPTPFNA